MEEACADGVCAQLVVQQLLCAHCVLACAHHAPSHCHPRTDTACSDAQDPVCAEVMSTEGAHACAQLEVSACRSYSAHARSHSARPCLHLHTSISITPCTVRLCT